MFVKKRASVCSRQNEFFHFLKIFNFFYLYPRTKPLTFIIHTRIYNVNHTCTGIHTIRMVNDDDPLEKKQ